MGRGFHLARTALAPSFPWLRFHRDSMKCAGQAGELVCQGWDIGLSSAMSMDHVNMAGGKLYDCRA
jgi:hypothetical protein